MAKIDGGLYSAWEDDTETALIARIAIRTGDGYGGPLRTAVAVDPSGTVIGIALADDKETPAWMERVVESGLISRLVGKNHRDDFLLGADVDGVTGATYTARAIADATADGSRAAADTLGLPTADRPPPKIVFGIPEVVLILLFGTLFELLGSSIQFAALGLVLIAALFIKRPWCNYLCPIRPVVDLIRLLRNTVKEQWRKATRQPAG